MKHFKLVLVMLRSAYRYFISPFIHVLAGSGFGCRYQETCSEYFFRALIENGWRKGTILGLKRLSRCHPWAKSEDQFYGS